jgi:hypothetical protein
MDSTFGVLDAFAFVVFAVLIAVAVIVFVSLGKLPGQLARKWGHPKIAGAWQEGGRTCHAASPRSGEYH